LEAFKLGCLKYDENYKPKLMFVVGTKRHYKKFFTTREGQVVNLTPGSVINEKIVRPDLPEFFMQSHYPIKAVLIINFNFLKYYFRELESRWNTVSCWMRLE
jgi:hypothetical protein